MICIGALLVAAATTAFPPAVEHPVHTTVTVISLDGRGAISLSIRAFADDFSASVARFAGRRAPADSSVIESEVTTYIREKFRIVAADGKSVDLAGCGVRRAGEAYLLCFRANAPTQGAWKILNLALTELHPDQVNIVRVAGGKTGAGRESFLFTRGSKAAEMRFRE